MDFKEPRIQIVAMPRHDNAYGDISTGYILEHFDLACGIAVKEHTGCQSITVAINKVVFKKPILKGDLLIFYASIMNFGKSSINLKAKLDLKRLEKTGIKLYSNVASAEATFISIDEKGHKIYFNHSKNQ